MKKGHIHACKMKTFSRGSGKGPAGNAASAYDGVERNDILKVFNGFYRTPVTELYKAVKRAR